MSDNNISIAKSQLQGVFFCYAKWQKKCPEETKNEFQTKQNLHNKKRSSRMIGVNRFLRRNEVIFRFYTYDLIQHAISV